MAVRNFETMLRMFAQLTAMDPCAEISVALETEPYGLIVDGLRHPYFMRRAEEI